MVHHNCCEQMNPDRCCGIQMSRKRFVEWLKEVDRDGDGRISRHELREALRVLGFNCTRWKAWRAMVHADLNRNKGIDIVDREIEELIKYAAKRWGIIVTD